MYDSTTTAGRPTTIPSLDVLLSRPVDSPKRSSSGEVRRGLAALRPTLYARALRMSRCPSRADDIVQETMVRALRFEHQFRVGTNLRAWVGQVLTSVFLTQCRRNKRERRALDNLLYDPCAWHKHDTPAMMTTLSKRPAQALASLPDSYRSAVQLVDLDGLSYREAAERLNVPVGTIMSRLHRGRKLLAAKLQAPALNAAA
ncbi:MAG TPA: RNA polymerase sigma factor [Sorangium sp.]|nr:RNA polymerase sigma factor [Sorangium sp.]